MRSQKAKSKKGKNKTTERSQREDAASMKIQSRLNRATIQQQYNPSSRFPHCVRK